jgi:hypothetical protein
MIIKAVSMIVLMVMMIGVTSLSLLEKNRFLPFCLILPYINGGSKIEDKPLIIKIIK